MQSSAAHDSLSGCNFSDNSCGIDTPYQPKWTERNQLATLGATVRWGTCKASWAMLLNSSRDFGALTPAVCSRLARPGIRRASKNRTLSNARLTATQKRGLYRLRPAVLRAPDGYADGPCRSVEEQPASAWAVARPCPTAGRSGADDCPGHGDAHLLWSHALDPTQSRPLWGRCRRRRAKRNSPQCAPAALWTDSV